MAIVTWVPSPNGRGTLDIIISCGATIFLCCWSSLCVNVPSVGDGTFVQLCDKLHLACIGMLGPELLFILALGQYRSARRSVKEFDKAGYKSWTIRHAFLADMGAYMLSVPLKDSPSDAPATQDLRQMTFPVDAGQLCYLVKGGFVDFSAIDEAYIAEQNDRLARWITILQVTWFSINSIARKAQHLEITTLELTTLAFIPCMFATSFCWFYKPTSVDRATVLKCKAPLADMIKAASREASAPHRRTPLDFVNREEWAGTLIWAHYNNILRKLHVRIFTRPVRCRPITRIPNDNWPELSMKGGSVSAFFALIYSTIFILGWNFPFPSSIERILWRASSVGTLGVTLSVTMYEPLLFRVYMARRKRYSHAKTVKRSANEQDLESSSASPPRKNPTPHQSWYGKHAIAEKVRDLAAGWRNNSPDRDPAMEVPLRVLIPITISCAAYCVFRAYILVEDVLGLRKLPPGAFKTVVWSNWFPHI
jgi:hypothetical protein